MCGVVLCSDEEPGVGRGAGQLRGAGEGGGRHVQCTLGDNMLQHWMVTSINRMLTWAFQ